MKHRQVFLGIDQTGAIDKMGRPRPLPACLIENEKITFSYIKVFSIDEILNTFPQVSTSNLVVCIDCVLGLPRQINIPLRQAMLMTNQFEGYGRKPAREYFLYLGKGEIHRRHIEIISKSNSVFAEKPFQKNIQTGTFRLWKELSLSGQNFYFPFLEQIQNKRLVPVIEGYPSLSWKILFNTKNRNVDRLTVFMKKISTVTWTTEHQKIVTKDPNLADALVLALTLKHRQFELSNIKIDPEGWILGL